jgi:light-harvesting complex 1 beta chain
MAHMTNVSLAGSPKNDNVAFKGIFAVSFVLFLAIALFAQLLMLKWRLWLPGAEGEKSLIHGVRSAVYTFMSYLN